MTTRLVEDQITITKPPYRERPRILPVTVPVTSPVVVEKPVGCTCDQQASNGFEQKIKENPLLFVLGALALGYFLAKK